MKAKKMRTFGEMHDALTRSGNPNAYWGERQDWYVVAGRSRDSLLLEEANWKATLEKLGGESDDVAIERESHWAVGWVEHMLIRPTARKLLRIAVKLRDDLEDYPIVCEETYSEMEMEATSANVKEAIRYKLWEWGAGTHVEVTDDLGFSVEQFLSDKGIYLENTDDQGGWPDDDDLEDALIGVGGTDRDVRAMLTDLGIEVPIIRQDVEGQQFMYDIDSYHAPQLA